jgi:hypothetical protein
MTPMFNHSQSRIFPPPSARRTVLDRLLALNHQRYAEEVKAGLHDKKREARGGQKSRRAGRAGRADQTTATGVVIINIL